MSQEIEIKHLEESDRLCGLVVLATDPEAGGSIPRATRFSE
jgi:hypothetical protein